MKQLTILKKLSAILPIFLSLLLIQCDTISTSSTNSTPLDSSPGGKLRAYEKFSQNLNARVDEIIKSDTFSDHAILSAITFSRNRSRGALLALLTVENDLEDLINWSLEVLDLAEEIVTLPNSSKIEELKRVRDREINEERRNRYTVLIKRLTQRRVSNNQHLQIWLNRTRDAKNHTDEVWDWILAKDSRYYWFVLSEAYNPFINYIVALDNLDVGLSNFLELPTVSVPAEVSVTEGANIVITVTLSKTSILDTTVTFQRKDGSTATAGTDYSITDTPLLIPAGRRSGTITVRTVNDTTDEPDETLTLGVSEVTNGMISSTSRETVVTIIDND